MSLLSRSIVPLWVFVIIIVVGSITVIGIVIAILQRWRIRQSHDRAVHNTTQAATRKVTVRRGRIVDSPHHLSLTGSKFGLNQVNEDVEAGQHRARSRSPFEWWTTIRDRSHLRRSEMIEPRSVRPSLLLRLSLSSRVYSDLKDSNLPSSPARLPRTPLSSPQIHTAPSPSKEKPLWSTNFSRVIRSYRPSEVPLSPSSRQLERLEEAEDEHVHGVAGNRTSAADESLSLQSTRELSLEPLPIPSAPSLLATPSRHSFSISLGSQSQSQIVHPSVTPPPPVQLPILAQSGLRTQTQHSPSTISSAYSDVSMSYRQPEQQRQQLQRHSNVSQPRMSKAVVDVLPESQRTVTGHDQRPDRSGSKRGKVLRKKSVKRAEVTSMVQ